MLVCCGTSCDPISALTVNMACMTQDLLPLQLHSQEETALQAEDRKADQIPMSSTMGH